MQATFLKHFAPLPAVIASLRSMLQLLLDESGDDYGEKAVILVLVVLGGVGAFAAFGGKIVELINQATSGI